MVLGVNRHIGNARQSPDRSYGEKLISLFAKLLFTGRRYCLTDLARSLGCSKQTVLRLINDISMAYAVPISEELVGRRKYVWIERPEALEPAALLSESEHQTLQMCRRSSEKHRAQIRILFRNSIPCSITKHRSCGGSTR